MDIKDLAKELRKRLHADDDVDLDAWDDCDVIDVFNICECGEHDKVEFGTLMQCIRECQSADHFVELIDEKSWAPVDTWRSSRGDGKRHWVEG